MRRRQEWWVEHAARFLKDRTAGGEAKARSPEDDAFTTELLGLIRDQLRYARCPAPDDLVQDLWLKLVAGQVIGEFDPDLGRFETYIGVIVRHALLDEVRAGRREREIFDPNIDPDAIRDLLASPEPPYDRDLWRATLGALEELSDRDRKALRDWGDGHTQAEIAKKLGMTTGGVGKLLWTLFRRIRREVIGEAAKPSARPPKGRGPTRRKTPRGHEPREGERTAPPEA